MTKVLERVRIFDVSIREIGPTAKLLKMTNTYNKIETIRTNALIENKTVAYLEACNQYEVEASKFATHEGFIIRKFAEEVSLSYSKAQSGDCEYAVYVAANSCERWMEQLSAKAY